MQLECRDRRRQTETDGANGGRARRGGAREGITPDATRACAELQTDATHTQTRTQHAAHTQSPRSASSRRASRPPLRSPPARGPTPRLRRCSPPSFAAPGRRCGPSSPCQFLRRRTHEGSARSKGTREGLASGQAHLSRAVSRHAPGRHGIGIAPISRALAPWIVCTEHRAEEWRRSRSLRELDKEARSLRRRAARKAPSLW